MKDVRNLVWKLTASLPTDQEKFRAIYKWVCSNIAADYELVMLNKSKRAKMKTPEALKRWNTKFSTIVFRMLIEERKTICTGYAYLVKELACHAGISCEIINGYAHPARKMNFTGSEPANHSWNVVKLGGKWYVCDATWSSGIIDRSTGRFVQKYNDLYF